MSAGLKKIIHAIEVAAAIGLAVVTIVVFFSAIGRYAFASPIPDNFDIAKLLLGATIMWGLAILNWRGGHIAVTLFTGALPPSARRVLDLFSSVVILAAMAIMAWKMFGRVETTYRVGEVTFDLRLPVWPLMGLIWLGAVAAVIAAASRLILVIAHPGQESDEEEEVYVE